MQKKTQVVLGTAALLAGAAVFFSAPQKTLISSDFSAQNSNQTTVKTENVSSHSSVQTTTSLVAGIESLQGTQHGVTLSSRAGELIVTAALRDLFDYYLSASGEKSHAQLVELIKADLQNQLSGFALQQAMQILDHYLAYKTALVGFNEQYPAAENATDAQQIKFLSKRQQALIALQNEKLGTQVAQIFFEYDRSMDEHTLSKAKILLSDMSDDGKQQALINLNAQLPFDAFQHQQRNQKQHQLMNIEAESGLSAQQKFQQRSEVVGEAAANRLAELDKQRAQWQSRLDHFQQEVNRLKSAKMAKSDYEAAYQKLLEQHFESHEQLRAKALTK